MTGRGSYANGLETRDGILDAGLALIAREGYAHATVQRVADEAGVSKAGLLHHFRSREALLSEILWHRDVPKAYRWFDAASAGSVPDLAQILGEFVAANIQDRNVAAFSSTLTAQASDASHPAHERVRNHYDDIERELLPFAQKLHTEGRLATAVTPSDLILASIALMEGLQLRWLYEPHLDVAGVVTRTLAGLIRSA